MILILILFIISLFKFADDEQFILLIYSYPRHLRCKFVQWPHLKLNLLKNMMNNVHAGVKKNIIFSIFPVRLWSYFLRTRELLLNIFKPVWEALVLFVCYTITASTKIFCQGFSTFFFFVLSNTKWWALKCNRLSVCLSVIF